MDFVIRQRMLLKEERKWLIVRAGVQRSALLWQAGEIHARKTDTNGIINVCSTHIWIQNWIYVSYSLISRVSFRLPFTNTFWTRSKRVSSIYSSGYGTPFHFLSQRSKSTDLWSAAHPLNNSWHWLVFFFPLSVFLVSTHGCAVGGFYSFSSFIKASPHLFVC